jgi:hypothetical protein
MAHDETAVLRIEILDDRGLFARSGHAVLTHDELSFEPSRIDAILGAEAWTVLLMDIDRLERSGFDLALVVHTPDGARRLLGRGADLLHERLAMVLARRTASPRERVLLEGRAELAIDEADWRGGTLKVTRQGLRFRADELNVSVSIFAVGHLEYHAVRRVLEVQTTDGLWRISGPLALPCFALLAGLRENPTLDSRFEVWDGARVHNNRERAGRVVLTAERFRFTSTSLIDALAGADETFDWPLAEIDRVALRGRNNTQIGVTSEGCEVVFRVPDAGMAFGFIRDALASVAAPGEPPPSTAGAVLDAEGLSRFSGHDATVMLAAPVVLLPEAGVAERAWLVVTDKHLRIEGLAGVRTLEWPDLHGPEGEPGPLLALRTETESIAMLPRGGARTAMLFWAKRPMPPKRMLDTLRGRPSDDTDASESRNRRESYRVSAPGRFLITITAKAEGAEPETLQLNDLSLGGLAVLRTDALTVADRYVVRVPNGAGAIELEAEVVHSVPRGTRKLPWRSGMAFRNATPDVMQELSEVWMAFQREELRLARGAPDVSRG